MNPLRAGGRIAGLAAVLSAAVFLTGAQSKSCGGGETTVAAGDAGDARTGATGGPCTLEASAYDQSCQVDSDCVTAFLGDVCSDVCVGDCPNAAISRSDSPRYNADLAGTPARIARPNGGTCSCALGPAFCRAGTCSIQSPLDDAGPKEDGGQCRWPDNLNDAGPGVRACQVGRAFLQCIYPSGVACGAISSGPLTELCISDDPTSCPNCRPLPSGATCTDQCAPGHYAVSCGGPPLFPLPDSGAAPVYQDTPIGCTTAGVTPAGNTYSCCPCQ